MISNEIAKQILTIGPEYVPPKGGIAQIIYNYSRDVFPSGSFRYISNSCEGNRIKKTYKLISALIQLFFLLLFSKGIKIIHVHTASNFSFKRSSWFVNIARLYRKKIIIHVHGGGFKTYYNDGNKEFVQKVLKRCDRIIVLSESWEDWFCDELRCENVRVVPNVVPMPQPFTAQRDGEIFHLLFLGLINEEKGIFDLVKTIAEYRDYLLNKFQLHIAGNGMVERLETEIRKHNLQELIKYEGWVDSTAKHELLSTCDALVLPSYTEGLPVSILEAMSYRMPIISTPVGGIPSLVEEGKNGFLVEPGDGEGFIQKIMRLTENRSLAEEMGKESYKRIDKHFPAAVSSVLMKIYKELIG